LLKEEVSKIPEVKITMPVEANGVFAQIPREITKPLQEKFFFYPWNDKKSEVRWMTSFDTTEEEIYELAGLIKELIKTNSK